MNQQSIKRTKTIKHVTVVGGVINLMLAIAKIILGKIGNSHALLADGVHSLSDLITDVFVWYAAQYSSQAPDDEHPYGHGRFETITTLGLATLLTLVGVAIIWDSINDIENTNPYQYHILIIATVIASIISKEALYWYTLAAAKRINSDMLKANAWHHRSDSISSIVVLLGIIGSLFGYHYLDNIAAVIVGIMIIAIGYKIGKKSAAELVDSGLDQEKINALKALIYQVDGVSNIHLLRTRKHGHQVIADLHIQVKPYITVSEGHYIALKVEQAITDYVNNLLDIIIHIDPEDDEEKEPCDTLPNRKQISQQINEALSAADIPEYVTLQLHYLNGKINVDFYYSLSLANHSQLSELSIKQALINTKEIGDIRLYFRQ